VKFYNPAAVTCKARGY